MKLKIIFKVIYNVTYVNTEKIQEKKYSLANQINMYVCIYRNVFFLTHIPFNNFIMVLVLVITVLI